MKPIHMSYSFALPLLIVSFSGCGIAPNGSSQPWVGRSGSPTPATSLDAPPQFSRAEGTELRLASYNVYFTSVFPLDDGTADPARPDRIDQFSRIAPAINADIWMLQETLYGRNGRVGRTHEGVTRYFQSILPADPHDPAKVWHASFSPNGTVIFSRYPILWAAENVGRGHAVLIDLPDSISDKNLLIINQHLAAYMENNEARVEEARAVLQLLQSMNNGEELSFPKETDFSIIIGGDFNSLNTEMPYRILAAQDPDVSPDGDFDRKMTDLAPVQLNSNPAIDFTYGSMIQSPDGLPQEGRRIDHILLQNGRFRVLNRCILNTLIQNDNWLKKHRLHKRDVALHPQDNPQSGQYDHLPIIADLLIP